MNLYLVVTYNYGVKNTLTIVADNVEQIDLGKIEIDGAIVQLGDAEIKSISKIGPAKEITHDKI